MEKIRLMIAEDHPMFRERLVQVLNEAGDIEVIGVAENGKVLVDLVALDEPDVVVLDLRMPVLKGQEVLEIFKKSYPDIRTVILSGDYSPYLVAEAITKGASAYLSKDRESHQLIEAVRGVYTDGYFLNDFVSIEVLKYLKEEKKLYVMIGDNRFSNKEIEVIQMLCDEVPAESIADKLHITKDGVLAHKKRIFKKTDSNNIVSLIKYAIKHGIFDVLNIPNKVTKRFPHSP